MLRRPKAPRGKGSAIQRNAHSTATVFDFRRHDIEPHSGASVEVSYADRVLASPLRQARRLVLV